MVALRVLVVADQVDKRDRLAHLLRGCGCQVTTASTGPDAVVASRTNRPHVAVLDLGLSGMDGDEVALQLKGEVEGLFLIVASEALQPTAESPVDFYITKDGSFDDLRWILGRLNWCLHGAEDAVGLSPSSRVCLGAPSTVGEMSPSGSA